MGYKEFHDYTTKDKKHQRPWKPKKKQNMLYSERLAELAKTVDWMDKKRFSRNAERVRQCASVLIFKKYVKTGKTVLDKAYFCKDRLCPVCQWRRSIKMGYQLAQTLTESLKRYPKSSFIFLTLTVKSVDGSDVRKTIRALNAGFKRMSNWVRVRKVTIGFFRSTEMTINRKDPNHLTFHPHLHVILQVKGGYFSGSDYISQSEWRKMWAKAMNLDYEPMVRVSKIRPKNQKVSSTQSAVLETAKYTVKSTTYLSVDSSVDMEIIRILKSQMSHLRMASYGFELKEIHNEKFGEVKNLEDETDDDLIHTSGDDEDLSEEAVMVTVFWQSHHSRYVEVEPKPIIK